MATKFKWGRNPVLMVGQGHGTRAAMHIKGISRPLENGVSIEVQSFRSVRWARRMVHRLNRHAASQSLKGISTFDLIHEVTARGFQVTRKPMPAVHKAKQIVVQKMTAAPHVTVTGVEAPKSRTMVYRGADSSADWHGVHPYAHEYLKRSGLHNHRR
jgi:hypothetical protein